MAWLLSLGDQVAGTVLATDAGTLNSPWRGLAWCWAMLVCGCYVGKTKVLPMPAHGHPSGHMGVPLRHVPHRLTCECATVHVRVRAAGVQRGDHNGIVGLLAARERHPKEHPEGALTHMHMHMHMHPLCPSALVCHSGTLAPHLRRTSKCPTTALSPPGELKLYQALLVYTPGSNNQH